MPSAQMVPYMRRVAPSGKAERKVGLRTGEPKSMGELALSSETRGSSRKCDVLAKLSYSSACLRVSGA